MNEEQIIAKCVEAYIVALLAAANRGLPVDDCTLVARLAYESTFQLMLSPLKNSPKVA